MTASQLSLAFRRAQWIPREPAPAWFPFILFLLSVLRLNALSAPKIGLGFWIMETVCLVLTILYCSRLQVEMRTQLASVVALTGLSWAFCLGLFLLGFLPKGWAGF